MTNVFLTCEFRDLGGEEQGSRALQCLVSRKRLVRLGYGRYGRAGVDVFPMSRSSAAPNGFLPAARQALNKLGVAWEPTDAEKAYNEGRST